MFLITNCILKGLESSLVTEVSSTPEVAVAETIVKASPPKLTEEEWREVSYIFFFSLE